MLSLTGGGRSGSTILGNVLGQVGGFFHGGELCYLWNRGVRQDALCGCGVPFSKCPVWTEVMRDGAVASFASSRGRLERFPRAGNRRLPLVMIHPSLSRSVVADAVHYADQLMALYTAIARVTGSRVIVDSSKAPSHVHVLARMEGIDLRVVHLLRDPRAVAHSWHRRVQRVDVAKDRPREQTRTSVGRGALKWAYSNVMIGAATRRMPPDRLMRVKYEEFVRDPVAVSSRIAALAGADEAQLPFSSRSDIVLGPTHTVWGNQNRLRTGPVKLRADEQWKSAMAVSDRILVTALSWPLLLRYGYPVGG
ncbi:MAG TPA: sulfotransferase [Thermomicrobiales bacterium]|nr:sulfotransferase [Thermomicrobiales bacterium]